MTNFTNNVFYVGVTNNLIRRVYEHKTGLIKGFTAKYNVKKLVYFEIFNSVVEAIQREKQLKGGSRSNKIKLVKKANPNFNDLYEGLV